LPVCVTSKANQCVREGLDAFCSAVVFDLKAAQKMPEPFLVIDRLSYARRIESIDVTLRSEVSGHVPFDPDVLC